MNSVINIFLLGVIILIFVDATIFILSLFNVITASQMNDSLIKASIAIVVFTAVVSLVLAISKFARR
jgi:hypothetical protein